MCLHCHNLGHVCQNCRKLQNKNRRFKSIYYQKSLKSASTSITTLVESGKTKTCFISSSSTWVIDSGAIDHMISNLVYLLRFNLILLPLLLPLQMGQHLVSLGHG